MSSEQPYQELAPVAAALGVTWTGGAEMKLSREGMSITVGLRIDSGTVRGVDLVVHRAGWPELELRRETDDDRKAKQSGLNVEVQTGDPTFDAFVYIESAYGQAVLAPLLSSPDLRSVLGEIVARYGAVTVGPDGLVVDTREGGSRLLDPAQFMPFFEMVLRAARLMPLLPVGAKKSREQGFGLVLLALFLVAFGIVALAVLGGYGDPQSHLVRPLGALVGVGIAAAAIPLIRRHVSGHSRSALYLGVTIVPLLIGMPLAMMATIVGLNASLDSSPPEALHGHLTVARSYVDDGEPKVEGTIDWASGRKEEVTLADSKPKAQTGDRVEAVLRHGLVFGWVALPPTIVPGKR
jgi:hypothetical protein